jgi:CDP-diglyceride synthetase
LKWWEYVLIGIPVYLILGLLIAWIAAKRWKSEKGVYDPGPFVLLWPYALLLLLFGVVSDLYNGICRKLVGVACKESQKPLSKRLRIR